MSSFSLTGASFAFSGLSPVECSELSAVIQAHGGRVVDAVAAQSPEDVYVITDYCAQTSLNPSDRFVTRFWFSEMLRLRRWLRPDAHPFFEPPPKATALQHPITLTGDDGDVKMDTLSHHKMQLPHSSTSRFRDQVPVWPYFAAYLAQPMHNVQDLAAALHLTTMSDPRRKFNCLEYAVDELLTASEQRQFFQTVLPKMVQLVLSMPQMFATPLTLLAPLQEPTDNNKTRVVTQSCRFSKLETLTLVCGCFFGIFPDQDFSKPELPNSSPQAKSRRSNGDDVIQFPYFTAVRMFSAAPNMTKMITLKGHKIRCLLQYFLRAVPRAIQDPAGLSHEIIDFTRVGCFLPQENLNEFSPHELVQSLDTQVQQSASPVLYPAKCVSDTLIEDLHGHLQIDFANKFAGGGVLNSGCVQEEIRFLLSPELLVACLVFAKLEPHEAFVIHGTERYSNFRGYGGTFEFAGNFTDSTKLIPQPDGKLRRDCVIVGIDATDYGQARVERQYTSSHVWRDLVKAFVGFAYPEAQDAAGRCWPVATGNWGCGVFQGDRELKFLIQWLAASLRHRELVYVLFERDLDLLEKVKPLLELATDAKAQEWDRQSSGLTKWLVTFLFEELNSVRRARGDQSVLARAVASLERALEGASPQVEQQNKVPVPAPERAEPQQSSPLPTATTMKSPSSTPKREDESDDSSAGLKKKPKMTKELQQKSIQDFFSPK